MDSASSPGLSEPPGRDREIREVCEASKVEKESMVSDFTKRDPMSGEAMKRSSDELEGIVVKDVNLEVVSEVIDAGVLEKAVTESSVNKDDEDGMNSKDGKGNTWALVSPDKVGRSQSKTLQRDAGVVQISASKFSVLSLDMEEGEILAVQTNEDEEEDHVEAEVNILVEGDLMGDEILEQSKVFRRIIGPVIAAVVMILVICVCCYCCKKKKKEEEVQEREMATTDVIVSPTVDQPIAKTESQ
ncbi:hypothetical protein F2Q69_00037041 [Brassica cretica]|uniref:Plant cysteine-rich protein domain-containing protein n=1 Tax=Brassica cretica TaxID=69181 RepID=A0A8S9SFC9_BRACR|nr:hypothetical protein F2Q69_00037041 [Brassica cretica]